MVFFRTPMVIAWLSLLLKQNNVPLKIYVRLRSTEKPAHTKKEQKQPTTHRQIENQK